MLVPPSLPSRLLFDAKSSILSREDSVKITSSDPIVAVKRENGVPATLVKAKSNRMVDWKKNNWIRFTRPI